LALSFAIQQQILVINVVFIVVVVVVVLFGQTINQQFWIAYLAFSASG